jgi:hypothetical protein
VIHSRSPHDSPLLASAADDVFEAIHEGVVECSRSSRRGP